MALLHFCGCAIFIPRFVQKLKCDFKRGRAAVPLKQIDLQQFAHLDISECRKRFNILYISPLPL